MVGAVVTHSDSLTLDPAPSSQLPAAMQCRQLSAPGWSPFLESCLTEQDCLILEVLSPPHQRQTQPMTD